MKRLSLRMSLDDLAATGASLRSPPAAGRACPPQAVRARRPASPHRPGAPRLLEDTACRAERLDQQQHVPGPPVRPARRAPEASRIASRGGPRTERLT